MLYYPPYHSKYHPVERCWGILEQHWNRTARSGSTPRLTDYNFSRHKISGFRVPAISLPVTGCTLSTAQ
ncbi:MAG: hypothetical protein KA125_04470 [Chromatiaceae bacterium]|nr:hypothetical protein [Chromatiaceae bacterium]